MSNFSSERIRFRYIEKRRKKLERRKQLEKMENTMRDEDLAKLAFAHIVQAYEEFTEKYDFSDTEHTLEYPTTITLNGKLYGFGEVDQNFLDKTLET